MSRITLGIATPRDLIALRASLDKIPSVRGLLQGEDASEQVRDTAETAAKPDD